MAVSLLPLAALFIAIYIFNPDVVNNASFEIKQAILFAIFISLAIVLMLSMLATKVLSKNIISPVHLSVSKLTKVVEELFKSIQDLSEISQSSSELSQFLLDSSQKQEDSLKEGSKAIVQISKAMSKIATKADISAQKTEDVDRLASQGEQKSKNALDSLIAIKSLLTNNQKLSQAVNSYAKDVKEISLRVESLAEAVKFLSLNMSIEASKSSFSDGFSTIIAQIRELNITSQQAASAIGSLADNMQRQLDESKHSSDSEWQETDKAINTLSQTITFLNKIMQDVAELSKSVRSIDKEINETKDDTKAIEKLIKDTNSQSQSLVKEVDNVSQTVNKQLTITRSLNRSSASLNSATDTLNNLVGKE